MEDRISSLPDSIISHILSFLPTKSSAATCILSKRWKPLWLSVLHLHFDCKRFFKDYTTFRHVVYLVMLSRQYAVPIQSLSLRLEGCKRIDIDNSVNAAVKQGLQTLELIMGFSWTKYHLENKLSLNVFNCKTSKNLRLIDLPRQIFPFSIQVPTFHNLIQLELVFCNFNSIIWDKKSTWMIEMLQHSPNLQHLTIHQETEDGNYDDNRQDPENIPKCVSSQLRTLVLREWRGTHSEFQFLQYVLENSTVLHTVTIHHHAKSITLYASQRLEELCRLHLRRARPPFNFRFSYG